MADVHCPHCDARNPAGAVRCWNCQENLKPEPSKDESADWLESLRGDGPSEEATPWVSGDNSSEEPPAGEAPDWLARIRDRSQSEIGQEDKPAEDWAAFDSNDAEQAEDVPDWMKDMAGEGDRGSSSDGDDWLSAFAASNNSASPDFSAGPPAAEPVGSGQDEPGEDWLKELQSWQSSQEGGEKEETPTSDTPSAETPLAWQAKSEEPEPEAGEEEETGGLGWLKSLSDEGFAPDDSEESFEEETPQEPAPFKMEDDGGMDWLSRFSSGEGQEQPAKPQAETPAETGSAGFMAGWDIPFEKEPSGSEPEPEQEEKTSQPRNPFAFEEDEEDWSPVAQSGDQPQERGEQVGLPSWLFAGDDEASPPASAGQPSAVEQPGSETGLPSEEPAAFTAEPGDLPDWLKNRSEVEQPAEDAETPETPFSLTETPETPETAFTFEEASEAPEETPETSEETSETPITPFTPFSAEELPAWLSEESLEPPVVEPVNKPAFVFDETGEFAEPVEPEDHPFSDEEMPEWLASGEEAEADAAGTPAEGAEIAPAQVPGWLEAMRPVEAVAPGGTAVDDSHTEKFGPLAGIQGTLPSEGIAGQYRKPPVYSIRLHVSDKQRAHATILEESIADESKPSEVRPQRKGVSQVLLRLLIAIILIGILLFSGALNRAEPTGSDPSFGYINFRTQVDHFADGAPVLVAFEYNPAYSAEMRLAASGVLEQLMRRNARITAISTTPAGPVLADALLTEVADTAGVTNTSDRIVNLGYLAGGTLSLQQFAISPQEVTRYQFELGGDRQAGLGSARPGRRAGAGRLLPGHRTDRDPRRGPGLGGAGGAVLW